jgi:putative membrane protein
MKSLSQKFLNDAEKRQVEAAVADAEKQTAGEIVVMIVPASYSYPMAEVIGAAACALPVSILLTIYIGGLFWMGTRDMWLFMGIFALLWLGFRYLVKGLPWLKRRFISKREVEEEVQEAAVTAFYQNGLFRTRDETGVLLYISVFEHKVWVLADRGINDKVPKDAWTEVVDVITSGIHEKRQGEAICTAVESAGGLLARHFPVKADDTNELKDLIIE